MSQLVRQEDPLNTEPYSKDLASSFITPNDLVFNRNHDSVVRIDVPASNGTDWTLSISVQDHVKLASDSKVLQQSLPLDAIKKNHKLVEVIATLECAGNRRSELALSHQPAEGIQWGNAVIANVIWGGASLRSVLLASGVPDPFIHHSDHTALTPSEGATSADAESWARSLHLHLFSAQESSESDPSRKEYFASSIPLSTAMHPNQGCLLAYQYNRQPLTQRHGAPLRAVLPGHVGARWVKWLNGLKISNRENDSPPMRMDYKLLLPSQNRGTEAERAFAEKASQDTAFRKQEMRHQNPLQRLEASCSITQPSQNGQSLNAYDGKIFIKGYAVGQDGSPATSVFLALVPETEQELSSKDLLTSLPAHIEWKQATIHHRDIDAHRGVASGKWSWAWTLWQLEMFVPSSDQKWALIARCVTASGVEQEKISEWNLRGFCNRSWSVVRHISVHPHLDT